MKDHQLALRLDREDFAALTACAELEKLPAVEILRKALRIYARQVGVLEPPKVKKAQAK